MAQSRYIEIKDGDTWASLAKEFGAWLKERNLTEGFGWSEGDALTINESISFFCFSFPDRYGERINTFDDWAKETGRLYGIKSGRIIEFPADTNLNVVLPPENEIEVPSWLK
ncbi:hypothetical protein [Photobacterium nomapromontoriensis]|uniref:hypothetical protein n=1 Tax=Photobacterium nomapromontoriensis TaxID=2910237 RepID=UPI003D0E9D4F